ncbi:MAG: YqaA family protein [Candidatus Acidiferrales bacterium]
MDILTIVLSARKAQLWPYYTIMATIGSVLGGYVTYRLARKGGREALERHFSRARIDRVNKLFARWGFGAIAIPATLPPPMPMVPFLFAAGAMQYSVGRFLAALTLGRIIRYSILAYLAARYGRHMRTIIAQNSHPVLLAALGGIALAVGAFIFFRYGEREARRKHTA